MPQVLLQLLEFCQRDDANLADLATIVSRDAGVTAKMFALASSAAFHGRARPATVAHCLQMLGMGTIKTVVINESVMQICNALAVGRNLDLCDYWCHSLRCALIARDLAVKMGYSSSEEAYLGGLLHDIGRLAIAVTDPDSYLRAFHESADDETLCAMEFESFALTHAEVGAWLVEKWGLDSFLGDSILYHHEPAERVVSAHHLIRIVRLAQHFSMLCGGEPSPSDLELAQLYGAPEKEMGALVKTAESELVTLAEQFGIILKEPRDGATRPETMPTEAQIAARMRDIVLVDRVLADSPTDCHEAAVQCIARAAKILFDIDAAIWFEPVDVGSRRFRAKPLGTMQDHVSQLEFVRVSSDSVIAGTPDNGPALLTPTRGTHVLDRQILKLLGGESAWLLPFCIAQKCFGILVCSGLGAGAATKLDVWSACQGYFGRAAAALLSRIGQAGPAVTQPLQDQLRGMMHEINNPLSIVRNYLHVLETELAGQNINRTEFAIMRDEMERIGRIVKSVLERDDASAAPQSTRLNLNQVVRDLVVLCRQSAVLAGTVHIGLDLDDDLPSISSDSDRLKQLLLNLLRNSFEALSAGGGTIRIATAAWGGGSVASHVEVCVEDDGPGIPKDILHRLYQPVTSTKGGEHQGLGLAIVGQLVRELRGMINCRSSGQGTRFQLLLPSEPQ